MTIIYGILLPFFGTVMGAGCVFFLKRSLGTQVQRALTGFAAGVMVAASIWSLLMALPDGYETIIGEGGANLSGGEKQRISIARAIMKDAPIVILDEATANVDPESEQELTNAIEALTKEKTIIMIAHRLKTVRHADNILVIDGGKIVQSGTHEQLMQQGGIYRRFVESRELAVGWKV